MQQSPEVEREATRGNYNDAPEEPPSVEQTVVAINEPQTSDEEVGHGATTYPKNASPEEISASSWDVKCRGFHKLVLFAG